MTPKAAADYLGTTTDNLAQMRHRGVGPSWSQPTRRIIRYHRDDLDRWLARSRHPASRDDTPPTGRPTDPTPGAADP